MDDDDDASADTAPILPQHLLTHFGREVRTARKVKGLTRELFALRCGLSVTTIKKLEQGDGPQPRLETLLRLANGLSVSLTTLLASVDPYMTDEDRQQSQSTNLWLSSLSEPQQELVCALIRVFATEANAAGERTALYAA